MRIESARAHDSGGWFHDPTGAIVIPRVAAQPAPKRDWTLDAERFHREAVESGYLVGVAESLGVSVQSLIALKVGVWRDEWRQQIVSVWPERDATGRAIGMVRRYPSQKLCMRGSSHGIYTPTKWRDSRGPVYIVEGGSDTAALVSCRLCVLGRPSCSGGAKILAEMLRGWRRGIALVAENDQKPERRGEVPQCPKHCRGCAWCWPGKDGAERVAATLRRKLGRRVDVIFPPRGVKDSREWLSRDGAFAVRWGLDGKVKR